MTVLPATCMKSTQWRTTSSRISGRQQALHQPLLRPLDAQRRGVIAQLRRPDLLPGVEVLVVGGGDRADVGPFAAGADQQLIGVEQPRLALAQPLGPRIGIVPQVAVAHELAERLVHAVGAGGVRAFQLALDHGPRQAVDEEHDVGDDERLDPARRVHPELVDGDEAVALRVRPVHQPDLGILLAGALVAADHHPRLADQLLRDDLVGLDQRLARHLDGQLVVQAGQLRIGEPG